VFQPSLRVWEAGDTPNPDVWCNRSVPCAAQRNLELKVSREVKFGALMKHLGNDGEWLATGITLFLPTSQRTYIDHGVGHYAKKGWKTPLGSLIPRPQLLRSSDPTKDQNYYLSAIPEKALARSLFPLGELTKADVRKIAGAAGLPTAQRNESMGICFVGQKHKFNEFLGGYISF